MEQLNEKREEMALRMSLQLPATSSISPPTKPSRLNISSLYIKPTEELTLKPSLTFTRRSRFSTVKAIEESQEKTQSEIVTAPDDSEPKPADKLAELGAEIKELKKTMSEKGEVDFWSGVAEEIKEIEWPAFGKVLGTTGVVLGVIAGSSVVLLTVNAVLAELSDKVFAGRGVQDFFG